MNSPETPCNSPVTSCDGVNTDEISEGITSNLPVSDEVSRLSSFYNDFLQETGTKPESKRSKHKTQRVESKTEFTLSGK
jgi:hypothetical protein